MTPPGADDVWLHTPEHWDWLAGVLRRARRFGLDSEFHSVDVTKQSCVGRAVIHVWSVAVRTKRLSPSGYHRCRGWVLPGAALAHPGLIAVLQDPAVGKDIHGAVDWHAFANHGISIRGGRNTLDFVRWMRPEQVNSPGRFKLKALMGAMLRRNPVCTYKELVTDTRVVQVVKQRKVKRSGCSCGAEGCRMRKPTACSACGGHGVAELGLCDTCGGDGEVRHGKWKREELEDVIHEKQEEFEWPLEQLVPGHPKFPLLLRYALEDAVAALQIGELAEQAPDPAPWPFGGARPGFPQDVSDGIVHMEGNGFPVDVAWCRQTAEVWRGEEEKELAWLHRWYVKNAPEYGPHRRESTPKKKNGVDCTWSSVPKKVALFDALDIPRSPIWKKGRVKQGDVKMDSTALEWIARNHPPAKQLIDHLLRLFRIRSGLKYVEKLRDSGGWVHPICGPAGDDDDRAVAVTGRIGIKGELEAQQLPTKEELDLLKVRRAIIA